MSMENTKKKEVVLAVQQIVNIPKFKVIGHETGKIVWNNEFEDDQRYSTTIERPPKEANSMIVIYLKDTT